MFAVLQQAGNAGGNPGLGILPFQLPLPVPGVLAAEHQALGPAVHPAEDAMDCQRIQVAADRGPGRSALCHQLVDGHLFAAPQQLTDQPVPLFSLHVQMLTENDHLIRSYERITWSGDPTLSHFRQQNRQRSLTGERALAENVQEVRERPASASAGDFLQQLQHVPVLGTRCPRHAQFAGPVA
ncbi:hypothetical protein D9M72_565910 [compost metagenome]